MPGFSIYLFYRSNMVIIHEAEFADIGLDESSIVS